MTSTANRVSLFLKLLHSHKLVLPTVEKVSVVVCSGAPGPLSLPEDSTQTILKETPASPLFGASMFKGSVPGNISC